VETPSISFLSPFDDLLGAVKIPVLPPPIPGSGKTQSRESIRLFTQRMEQDMIRLVSERDVSEVRHVARGCNLELEDGAAEALVETARGLGVGAKGPFNSLSAQEVEMVVLMALGRGSWKSSPVTASSEPTNSNVLSVTKTAQEVSKVLKLGSKELQESYKDFDAARMAKNVVRLGDSEVLDHFKVRRFFFLTFFIIVFLFFFLMKFVRFSYFSFFLYSPQDPRQRFSLDRYEERMLKMCLLPPSKVASTDFDSIGGLSRTKQTVQDLIRLPLKRPDLFQKGILKQVRILGVYSFFSPYGF
jgi:hypothetical protein